jgi:hypothetical protein
MAITTVTVPPRIGTSAEWAASTLVLADGEVGFDSTANIVRIGNGSDTWASLGVVAGGNSGTAKTIPDGALGGVINVTLTGNVTFTFPTAAAGASFKLRLATGAGSFTATWPATVKWPGGTAPTVTTTASRSDDFEFTCFDGTNWHGQTLGQNYNP